MELILVNARVFPIALPSQPGFAPIEVKAYEV